MKTFTEKVINIVKKIPKGKTMTYKEVAIKADGNAIRYYEILTSFRSFVYLRVLNSSSYRINLMRF